MFNVVLVHPEIPPNTGNVIRLCANTGAHLHLIEPLGFPIDHSKMRRAGLDYHELTRFTLHADWQTFLDNCQPPASRMFAITTRGGQLTGQTRFDAGDWLVFGSETSGLGAILEWFAPEQRVRIPMRPDNRSMNLSNAVAVVVYEAWRQQNYLGGV